MYYTLWHGGIERRWHLYSQPLELYIWTLMVPKFIVTTYTEQELSFDAEVQQWRICKVYTYRRSALGDTHSPQDGGTLAHRFSRTLVTPSTLQTLFMNHKQTSMLTTQKNRPPGTVHRPRPEHIYFSIRSRTKSRLFIVPLPCSYLWNME